MELQKFDINNYSWKNVGSTFLLADDPNSNFSYTYTIGTKNDKLVLLFGGGEEVIDKELYLKRVLYLEENNSTSCSVCGKEGHIMFNGKMICNRHFQIERKLATMRIRDFLYSFATTEDFELLGEVYSPYVHNDQDLKFPCVGVMDVQYDDQYDMPNYTLYILNGETLNEIDYRLNQPKPQNRFRDGYVVQARRSEGISNEV